MFRLAYVYLLRVPVLAAIAVALLTSGAFFAAAPGNSLLRGVFDVSPGALFVVALQAALLAISLTVVTDLVIRQGAARFKVPPLGAGSLSVAVRLGGLGLRRITLLFLALYSAVALFVLVCAIRTSALGVAAAGLAVFCGFAVALVVLFGGLRFFSRQPTWLVALFRWLARWAGSAGYLDPQGKLLPGHGTATLCAGIFGALFLVFAFDLVPAATLVSVLNLILFVAFVLAGAAFLFDAFRFPVLIAIGILLLLTAQFQRSDQYFATRDAPAGSPAGLTPREVLAAGSLRSGDFDRAVVVCAEGGGIQTGAWAARVLAGLEEATDGGFSPLVRLVSSVSGGSYGTVYYTASFADGKVGNPEAVVESALQSSLDEIVSGLVYRDLVRILAPIVVPKLSGRGPAAEAAWLDPSRRPAAPPPGATLASWREDVRKGLRPAHIFNATVAETGDRFLLSTVDLGPATGRREFTHDYPERDLSPVTAARLSSAFPYVGAAARIDTAEENAPHFVDGGYFDNFGVVSAVDFLLAATDGESPPPVHRVLLVGITGFDRSAARPGPPTGRAAPPRGWFYQVFAPLQGLLSVRGTAQRSRNEVDLEMLDEVLARRGVQLERATFAYPEEREPLSWHLTAEEQDNIEKAWVTQRGGSEVQRVRSFLR